MKTHDQSRAASSPGFTLIELLTVIAIIGVLAAILIPVVGRVRQSAYASKSSSNLRQLALGANLYANETKGNYYPSIYQLNSSGDPDFGKPWTNDATFAKYLNVKRPDWLPTDHSPLKSGFPNAAPYPTEPGRATIGYNNTGMTTKRPYFRQTEVKNPSKLIMFAEAVDYRIVYDNRGGWTEASDSGVDVGYGRIAYRAGGKTIISTYSGAVLRLSRTEADDQTIWKN